MSAHTDQPPFGIDPTNLRLKYQATIREIGPMVSEFIPHGILIFFGETAPEELREVALIHDGTHLAAPIVVGDLLKFVSPAIADQPANWYRITAIGEMANANLAELGHLVIHFDGAQIASLPGTVSVEPTELNVPLVGTTFELFGL